MLKRSSIVFMLLFLSYLTGCASVPLAPAEDDELRKRFAPPPRGAAGLYIYRNSSFGGALKKSVYINGKLIGETAPKTYFYKAVKPGNYKITTESEFGDNDLLMKAKRGKNYFIRQSIKMGVFVGGAKLTLMSEEEGREGVLECRLAQ